MESERLASCFDPLLAMHRGIDIRLAGADGTRLFSAGRSAPALLSLPRTRRIVPLCFSLPPTLIDYVAQSRVRCKSPYLLQSLPLFAQLGLRTRIRKKPGKTATRMDRPPTCQERRTAAPAPCRVCLVSRFMLLETCAFSSATPPSNQRLAGIHFNSEQPGTWSYTLLPNGGRSSASQRGASVAVPAVRRERTVGFETAARLRWLPTLIPDRIRDENYSLRRLLTRLATLGRAWLHARRRTHEGTWERPLEVQSSGARIR